MTQPRRQKGKPTFEQRLEAVNQTLELVAGMQIETEKELTKLAKIVLDTTKGLGQLADLSKIVMTSHEARIKKLERKGAR